MPTIQADDLYERLGIERTATREEVRAAYRALLREYPPERAPEEFKRIREAYETLNDAASRAEYDRAPAPAVQRLLRLASASMEAKSYGDAEAHLRQVLAEDPSLDYARNWLGLCFLYQDKAGDAVPEFEKLLERGEPAPAWFGNAGHAYAKLTRFEDAERMFRRAILAADANGEEVTTYYVALADLYIDRKNLDGAEELLEKAIRHDGEVDFEDLQYFTKLLEVQLIRDDRARTVAVLQRIKEVAKDEKQREYTAWKLAMLGCQLVAAGAFSLACAVSRASTELLPADKDYQALVRMSSLLDQRQVEQAEAMLKLHASFLAGGWMERLAPKVQEHCSNIRVFGNMKPLKSAPMMFTLNSVGTRLYGKRDFDARTGSYVATLYFVMLFLPLIPLGCYRVIPAGDRGWKFMGKVPFSPRDRKHLVASLIVCGILAITFVVAGLNAPPDSGTYDSGTYGSSSPPVEYPASSYYQPSPTPGAFSPGNANAREQVESERFRVNLMEVELQRLQSKADSLSQAIDSLEIRIPQLRIEQVGAPSPRKREEYQRLVRRHNALVEEYNTTGIQLRTRNAEYRNAVAELNRHIDQVNATP
jgi:curved DNA-binding protein CbpA